jgi:hypothetical protein
LLVALACRGQQAEPAPRPAQDPLPALAVDSTEAARINKIALTLTDDQDPPRPRAIVLERTSAAWEITSPLRARASADKVASLIANLRTLHVWKVIDPGTSSYERYDLVGDKALHVEAWTPARKVSDFFCGKSSTDGQLARVAGRDGIYALVNWGPQGYAGFLYTRDLRSWRETAIFDFDPRDARRIEISNRHGALRFARAQGGATGWMGSFTPRAAGGALGKSEESWPRFAPEKVDEMLQAYHALSADDFGRDEDRAASGVAQAEQTGGVIHIELEARDAPLTIRVGRRASDTSRYAIPGNRWAAADDADGPLYVLAPWTADWATADRTRFEAAH